MMESNVVSIIVTTYNLEKYIGRCAGSLFAQTLTGLEIVFVDDCSTDRTLEVLADVIARHPGGGNRVKIVPLDRNQGVSNARLQGLMASGGEYVIFLDGDDWYEPDTVENMYKKAVQTGAEMVSCRILWHFEDGSSRFCPQIDETDDRDRYARDMIGLSSCRATSMLGNKLFRRTLIEGIQFWPVGNTGEDWGISAQAAIAAEKPASANDTFMNYTVRSDSLTHLFLKEECHRKSEKDRMNIEGVISVLESKGIIRNYRDEIVARKFFSRKIFESPHYDRSLDEEWMNHFREINRSVLANPCLSLYSKKVFLLRALHLYGTYYGVRGFLLKKVFRRRQN